MCVWHGIVWEVKPHVSGTVLVYKLHMWNYTLTQSQFVFSSGANAENVLYKKYIDCLPKLHSAALPTLLEKKKFGKKRSVQSTKCNKTTISHPRTKGLKK